MDWKAIVGALVVILFTAIVRTYSRDALWFALVSSVALWLLVVWRDLLGTAYWGVVSTLLVGVCVGSAVAGLWWFIVVPKWWPPAEAEWETTGVVVAPASFQVRGGQWRAVQTVTVTNTDGARSAYAAWISVRYDAPGIAATTLAVTGPIDQEAPVMHGQIPGAPSFDGWGLLSRDAAGREGVLLNLYRIRPGEERTLQVTSSSETSVPVSVELWGYRRAPWAAWGGGVERGLLFQTPRPITMLGYYFIRPRQ